MGRVIGGGSSGDKSEISISLGCMTGGTTGCSSGINSVWGRRFLAANAMSICMLENEIAINKPKIIQLSHLEAMAI